MSDFVAITLRAPFDGAEPALARRWALELERMLGDVEKEVSQTPKAGAHWHWASDVEIPLRARANGITRETLQHVARVTRSGLQAATLKGPVEWPSEFPPGARDRARKITNDINEAEVFATVAVTGDADVTLEPDFAERHRSLHAKRVPSTVEGTLRSLADRGGWTEGRLLELFTGRQIWLRLTDTQGDEAAAYFRKRVIIEGWVAYDAGGYPTSVTHVSRLMARLGGRLTDYVGAAPELTGGLTPEAFLARMRAE